MKEKFTVGIQKTNEIHVNLFSADKKKGFPFIITASKEFEFYLLHTHLINHR